MFLVMQTLWCRGLASIPRARVSGLYFSSACTVSDSCTLYPKFPGISLINVARRHCTVEKGQERWRNSLAHRSQCANAHVIPAQLLTDQWLKSVSDVPPNPEFLRTGSVEVENAGLRYTALRKHPPALQPGLPSVYSFLTTQL